MPSCMCKPDYTCNLCEIESLRAEVRELREGIGLMADSMEGSLSMPLDAVGYENAIADFVDDLRALLEGGVGPMMLGRINRKARALLKGGE